MYSARCQVTLLAILLMEPFTLAHGDGLFYQLPKDGSWVLYSLRVEDKKVSDKKVQIKRCR